MTVSQEADDKAETLYERGTTDSCAPLAVYNGNVKHRSRIAKNIGFCVVLVVLLCDFCYFCTYKT